MGSKSGGTMGATGALEPLKFAKGGVWSYNTDCLVR